MNDERRHAEVIATYERAMRLIDEGATAEAEVLGEALREAQFSGAFEVIAQAHVARGRLDAALSVLEEGTRVAPTVWRLWALTGDICRQRGDSGGVRAAYERAILELARAAARRADGAEPPTVSEALATASGEVIDTLAELARLAEGRSSTQARHFDLTLAGEWPDPGPEGQALGFSRTMVVVAESPEDALARAAAFVRAEVRATLRMDEARDRGPCPDALLGVHHVSGYIFFPR